MKLLKRLLRHDVPPEKDHNGDTVCYCGCIIFSASYNMFYVVVECMKCHHWWWEL